MVDLASAGKAGWHGTGTISRRTQLLSKHFKIIGKAPDGVLYKYFVHITAEDKRAVKGKGIARVLSRLFQTYSSELAGKKFAYDGEKYLYTVDHLPLNYYHFTVVLEETFGKSENVNVNEGTRKSFTVELSYAASIHMQSISLEGANVNNTQDALKVLHVILQQQAPNMNFTDVGAGVVGVQGFYFSFLWAQGGLSCIMDFLLAKQSVQEPRYVDRVKMFDYLGGHGTTIGAFKFDKGVAAFVDSRTTFTSLDNKKQTLEDNRTKHHTISTISNILYIAGGNIYKNGQLIELLQLCVAEEERATKSIVTIDRAVQLMLKSQDDFIKQDPTNDKVFGGILIGRQEEGVYQAYVVQLVKRTPCVPVCLSDDVPVLSCGSGSTVAIPKLMSLFKPKMSRETATSVISETMLETTLHSYSSGGEINAFFFYDGDDMYELGKHLQIIQSHEMPKLENEKIKHHHVLHPIQIHLQHKDYLSNRIIFLVLIKSDAGPWTDVEVDLARRPGVICASVVVQKLQYLLYRILFLTADAAKAGYESIIGPRIQDGDGAVTGYIPCGFVSGNIFVANKTVKCLVGRYDQVDLEWFGS